MFKEQMNKIKSLISNKKEGDSTNKNGKKKIDNLFAFLIILIITLIAINFILKSDEPKSENVNSPYKELAEEGRKEEENVDDELETRIENILGTMSGVRKSKGTCYIF